MKVDNNPKMVSQRFGFLRSSGECARPTYDRVLLEIDGCVVTPTLGSILPNWLLIVPRTPTTNFAVWEHRTGCSAFELVTKVLNSGAFAKERAVWFEHGPAEIGSKLGCGVDQAHLHLIFDAPFSIEEVYSAAAVSADLTWNMGEARAIYQNDLMKSSYLVAGSTRSAAYVKNVDHVGSQFLRRVIANLARLPEAWNYRTHPHLQNVESTVRAFEAGVFGGGHRVNASPC